MIRPIPTRITFADVGLEDEGLRRNKTPACMCGVAILCVFKHLPVNDLLSAMRVCREWARWSIQPCLWQHITLPPEQPLSDSQLEGIVRRQPRRLTLDWVKLTLDEMKWLLQRLPQMTELDVEGLDWGEIRALATYYAPPLRRLNAGFVNGMDNEALVKLFSSYRVLRPGQRAHIIGRLLQVTHLSIARSHVNDKGIEFLCTKLKLIHLDISSCYMIDNNCVEIIADYLQETLESLDVRECCCLTVMVLPQLARLKLLSNLGIGYNPLIPSENIRAWTNTYGYKEKEAGYYERAPPYGRQAKLAMPSRIVKFAFQLILNHHVRRLRLNQMPFLNICPYTFTIVTKACDGKQADEPNVSTSQSKKSCSIKEKENLPESFANVKSENITTQRKSLGKKESSAGPGRKQQSPSKNKAMTTNLQENQSGLFKLSNSSKEYQFSKESKTSSIRASTATVESNKNISLQRPKRQPLALLRLKTDLVSN